MPAVQHFPGIFVSETFFLKLEDISVEMSYVILFILLPLNVIPMLHWKKTWNEYTLMNNNLFKSYASIAYMVLYALS